MEHFKITYEDASSVVVGPFRPLDAVRAEQYTGHPLRPESLSTTELWVMAYSAAKRKGRLPTKNGKPYEFERWMEEVVDIAPCLPDGTEIDLEEVSLGEEQPGKE